MDDLTGLGFARPSLVVAAMLLGAVFAACGSTTDSTGSGGSGGTVTPGDGLPCDVVTVLQDRCWTCHGTKLAQGVPMPLVTYDDLVAPAKSDASKTVAELSIERMKSSTAPMPPGGGATMDDIATLQAWVDAGTPTGTCEPGTDPFGGDVVCTSGEMWTLGTDVSDPLRPQMNPGQACNTCHSQQPPGDQPPIFLVAGTVYPTGHEPDSCLGVDGTTLTDVMVVVTDSQSREYTLPVNKSGNFLLEEVPFEPPYSAKVISSKGERAMTAKQTSGDCNACHTEAGGGEGSMAPGRIVVPY